MWNLLFSFIWGTAGMGMLVYGKKADSPIPMVMGAILLAGSYFLDSIWINVVGLICMGLLWMIHRGNS